MICEIEILKFEYVLCVHSELELLVIVESAEMKLVLRFTIEVDINE